MDTGTVVAGIGVECLLCAGAFMDIRSRRLSVILLVIAGAAGLPVYLIFHHIGIASLCGGAGIGAVMLVISYWTDGGIGTGDGWILCITGLYLGFYRNMVLLFAALVLAAVWSVLLIVVRKAGRKTEIPFVPFLLVTHTVMLACG